MDEIAIYNTLLSATDVQNHYKNGTNAAPSQTYNSLIAANNPLAYWRLNDSTTNVYPGVANSVAAFRTPPVWLNTMYQI